MLGDFLLGRKRKRCVTTWLVIILTGERELNMASQSNKVPLGAVTAIRNFVDQIECVTRVWLVGSRVTGVSSGGKWDLDIAIETAGERQGEALAAYMSDVSNQPGWKTLEGQFGVRMGITPAADVRASIADHGILIFARGLG